MILVFLVMTSQAWKSARIDQLNGFSFGNVLMLQNRVGCMYLAINGQHEWNEHGREEKCDGMDLWQYNHDNLPYWIG